MLKTIGSCHIIYKLITNNCACISTKILGSKLEPENKKSKKQGLKITLISTDDDISIVNLTEAEKLSKRRDLKLVKILDFDTKTKRPVYQLMTGTDYHEEELKKREEKRLSKKESAIKGSKLITISARIGQHDLETRLKNLSKWLNKQYEVKVVISETATNKESSDKIFSLIEQNFVDQGRILQKQMKGTDLKFNLIPTVKNDIPAGSLTEQPRREMHTEGGPDQL